MKNLDKYRGCLIGGAAGDALGYAIEFYDEKSIFERYGENGISEYRLSNGVAKISDDTQMTLFTANGLIIGRYFGIESDYTQYIAGCYSDWLKTQNRDFTEPEYSWLNNIPEMNHNRAPGCTCINYIQRRNFGSVNEPVNNSKGCGGVMRVAPIGLIFGNDYPTEKADMLGAEAAALTHGHTLGYIPAAALVHIIKLVSHNDNISLREAVKDMQKSIAQQFSGAEHISDFTKLIDKAVELSQQNINDLEAIHELGEGWVAEETLAIAVYCALKYSDSFEKAIIASVNHKGDSDSTGAVTGNILGAYLGLKNIPQKFLENLELKDVITEIADDLYNDCQISEYSSHKDEIWEQKYIYHTYSV